MVPSGLPRVALGSALAVVCAASTPRPASAQVDNINAGMMSPRSVERKLNERQDSWPAPVPGFTHGVRPLPGGHHHGTTVVIVGGYPCYVPSYYDPGFYRPGVSFGFQTGSFGIGYSNRPFAPNYPPAAFMPTFPPPVYPQGNALGTVRRNDGTIRGNTRTERSTAGNDDEGYYLNRKPRPTQRDPELADTISDIEQAFRTRNIALLARHVDSQDTLVLQSKGRSRKDLPASVYLQMTKDALADMRTSRFVLDHVEPASNGAWLAYGSHVIQSDGGAEKRYSVGFVLKKREGRYLISEVSADPVQ